MAKFIPRLSTPSKSDKNWIHYTFGGYNYCMHIKGGSCLPNCVGYAWGRWRELLGSFHRLSRANAEDWWANKDGYERGQTPKVGAVTCWAKGKPGNGSDGAGHVSIVEKVISDTQIVTSESGYGSNTLFWTKTRHKGNGNWGAGSAYTFQGFIYPPITFDKEVKTVKIDMMVLNKGCKDDQVKTLQRLLNAMGQKLDVDGSFGPATDKSVRAFQKANGLEVDGYVGKATWSKLLGVK